MDPFKLFGLPLSQPWESGWGAAVCNPSSATPGDVVTASVLIAAEQKQLHGLLRRAICRSLRRACSHFCRG
eukprot:6487501-Amphidinium_carterae.1